MWIREYVKIIPRPGFIRQSRPDTRTHRAQALAPSRRRRQRRHPEPHRRRLEWISAPRPTGPLTPPGRCWSCCRISCGPSRRGSASARCQRRSAWPAHARSRRNPWRPEQSRGRGLPTRQQRSISSARERRGCHCSRRRRGQGPRRPATCHHITDAPPPLYEHTSCQPDATLLAHRISQQVPPSATQVTQSPPTA